ncbi:tryptophan-rich protein [Plasmodium ovale]|nr:tryptophan-rich protein [Plasmodium ovale]
MNDCSKWSKEDWENWMKDKGFDFMNQQVQSWLDGNKKKYDDMTNKHWSDWMKKKRDDLDENEWKKKEEKRESWTKFTDAKGKKHTKKYHDEWTHWNGDMQYNFKKWYPDFMGKWLKEENWKTWVKEI